VSTRALYWNPDKAIAALGLAPGPTDGAFNRARFDAAADQLAAASVLAVR
jgi:hypothetical protein